MSSFYQTNVIDRKTNKLSISDSVLANVFNCLIYIMTILENVMALSKYVNPNKAPGPDGICGHTLSVQSSLGRSLSIFYNFQLTHNNIPKL